MIDKIKLLEKKADLQAQYIQALESNNFYRTSFLRGQLTLIEALLHDIS